MKGGYIGKILRVDLNEGTFRDEALPDEAILRKVIGGVGLGLWYLYDERPWGKELLAPEEPLIVMTGPFTGTPVPGSSDWTVINFNTQTRNTLASSHGHGHFGAMLKFAGYDGIIVTGISPNPVYLFINNGKAELRDASAMWGRDSHETEDLVRAEVGINEVSVAAIGQGGENLVAGALIQSDKNHHAAKGDPGVLMGSKKLKAMAVYGEGSIPIADPGKLLEISLRWKDMCFLPTAPATLVRHGGLTGFYTFLGDHSQAAAKNYLSPELGTKMTYNYVDAFATGKLKKTPNACFGCPVACAYNAEIMDGHLKGHVATLSGGGENLEAAAAMVGITDAAEVVYLADLYDRLGLDCPVGLSLGLAFECYEKGIITKEDTGGLELKWGDFDAVIKLLDMTVKKEGIGKILAEGPAWAAKKIGGDAPKFAVHMKNAGPHIHDWRGGEWSVLLGQAVAGCGPRFEGLGADGLTAEPDMGYPTQAEPYVAEGKALAVKLTANHLVWADCAGLCMFTMVSMPGITKLLPEALGALTGWDDMTSDEYLATGERVVNFERLFNLKAGMTPADDLNVSPRLLEDPGEGAGKGKPIAPYFEDMVWEYYDLMDWDKKTGRPSKDVIKRLDLEEYEDK